MAASVLSVGQEVGLFQSRDWIAINAVCVDVGVRTLANYFTGQIRLCWIRAGDDNAGVIRVCDNQGAVANLGVDGGHVGPPLAAGEWFPFPLTVGDPDNLGIEFDTEGDLAYVMIQGNGNSLA